MMRWLLALALALAVLAVPAMAAPTIRAVFVGIDQYKFSSRRVTGAGFDDLAGAVGDVGRIRVALGSALRLDFGPMPTRPDCQTATQGGLPDQPVTVPWVMPKFIQGYDSCRDGVVMDIVDLVSCELAERVVVCAVAGLEDVAD